MLIILNGEFLISEPKNFQVSPSLKQVSFHLSPIKGEGKKAGFQWYPDVYFNKFTNQSTCQLEWIMFIHFIENKTQSNSSPAFFHVHFIQGHTFFSLLVFFSFFLGHLQPPLTTKMQGYKCKGAIHHEVRLENMSSTKMHMNLWYSKNSRVMLGFILHAKQGQKCELSVADLIYQMSSKV